MAGLPIRILSGLGASAVSDMRRVKQKSAGEKEFAVRRIEVDLKDENSQTECNIIIDTSVFAGMRMLTAMETIFLVWMLATHCKTW